MRSRIAPMKEVAKRLRNHRALLLNWFRVKDRINLGAIEGFNNKAKLTQKKPTVSVATRWKNRLISYTWWPTCTNGHPQILLKNLKKNGAQGRKKSIDPEHWKAFWNSQQNGNAV